MWGSIQRSSGGCCVFWLQEAAIPKVHHIFVCRGMSYSSVFSVDTDTFSNNRLSLILHSEHPARHMVSLHVESAAKGASVLYETLKDSETASSEEPGHAPIMYANNKEGITGTFFDWMRQEVRKFLVHVRVIHLILFLSGCSERGMLRSILVPPQLNCIKSYHRSMGGLNYIMGSLAVLTRACYLHDLQYLPNRSLRVPLRKILYCCGCRWRYWCILAPPRENAQKCQDHRSRFARGSRTGPRSQCSVSHSSRANR